MNMANSFIKTISLERGSSLFNRRVLAMGEIDGYEFDPETLRDQLKFNLIFRSNVEELFQRHSAERLIGDYLTDLTDSNENIGNLIETLPQLRTKLDFEARLMTIRRLNNQLNSCRLTSIGNLSVGWIDGKLYYLSPCGDGSVIVTSADMKGSVYDSPIMYHDGEGEIVAWRTEDCVIDYLTSAYGPTVAIRPTISRNTGKVTKVEFHGDIDIIPGQLTWLPEETLVIENDYLYLGDLDQLLAAIIKDDDDEDEEEIFNFDDLLFGDDDEDELEDDTEDDILGFGDIDWGDDDEEEEDAEEDDEVSSEEDDFTIDSFLERDRLIEYPYVAFDAYLRFLELAATDSRVIRISICLYRIGENPILFYVLREAARRGKDVTVNLEPAANGEEVINSFWVKEMRDVGIRVLDNGDGLHKVHAKLTSIVLDDGRMIAQIGTGNYHWKTSTQYNDLSLITSEPETCRAVEAVFRLLRFETVPLSDFGEMILTEANGEEKLISLIKEQAKLREKGFIAIKANSFDGNSDVAMELERASLRGCCVDMIIRGSCTWVPTMLNRTVRIRSVVGEQLEHARVYQFGEGTDAQFYLGSLDPINRKLKYRLEAMVKVIDEDSRDELKRYLDEYLEGRVGNVWRMTVDDDGLVDYYLETSN